MKQVISLAIASFFLIGTAMAQEAPLSSSTDLTATLQYFVPGEDDDYDVGYGAEVQVRFWQNQNIGFALAGGLANWDINEQEAVVSDGEVAVGVAIEGSVLLLPIGGSILFRPTLADNLNLVFEAGLRYVFVESDAQLAIVAADAYGSLVGGSADIEMDDGFIGLVAVNFEAEVAPGFSLIGGVGYQFDIAKGDAKWMGEDFGENELEAFFIRVGIAVTF